MKATFEADFSNFNREVDKSVAKMKTIEQEANQVNVSLNRMVDEFSGQRIIEQANAMGLALTAIGGASKLTDDELKKVAATTVAAADRFLAFGKEVPPTMQAVIKEIQAAQAASAAYKAEVDSWGPIVVKADQATQGLHGKLSSLSTILGALGLQLPTQISDISQLATTAEGAAGAMGTLAQAASVVGGTLAAIKIGSVLGDWAKTETIIPNFVAQLLEWGDVAAETSKAVAESLSRASIIAGRDITSATEALEINTAAQKENEKAGIDRAKALAAVAWKAQADEIKDLMRDYREIEATQKRLSAESTRLAEEEKRRAEERARLTAEVHRLEQGINETHAGRLGMIREEQQLTQKQLEASAKSATLDEAAKARTQAARGLSPTGVPLELAQNPFSVLTEDMKALDLEVKRLTEETGSAALAVALTEGRRTEATDKFTKSMQDAAKANDDWIKSLQPRVGQGMFSEGEAITPWSALAPKAIQVRPITPGSFGGIGAPNVNMQISGILDPRTISELARAVGPEIIRSIGRQLPNA